MTDESPPQAGSPFRLPLLKDQLEVLAKGAAALLVIFYILGFLVVSAANYKHGIMNFGLFQVVSSRLAYLPRCFRERLFGYGREYSAFAFE